MLKCVAVCCSVLQCVVVCCSVLQCVADVKRDRAQAAGSKPADNLEGLRGVIVATSHEFLLC